MTMRPRSIIGLALLWAVQLGGSEPSAEDLEFFEFKIRPVLAENCYRCHSKEAKKLKGGLKLDSRAGFLKGGDLRPSLNLDNLESSLLLEAIGWKSQDLQMPPKAPCPNPSRKTSKSGLIWVLLGLGVLKGLPPLPRRWLRLHLRPPTLGFPACQETQTTLRSQRQGD